MGRGEDRMSFELAMLAASCMLCFVQIVISSHAASLQRGYRWTASSRDVEAPPLTGVAGRLERALRNFLETFPVFVAAVLLVHVLGRESAVSEWGARSAPCSISCSIRSTALGSADCRNAARRGISLMCNL